MGHTYTTKMSIMDVGALKSHVLSLMHVLAKYTGLSRHSEEVGLKP